MKYLNNLKKIKKITTTEGEKVVLLPHKSNNSKVKVNLNFDNDNGKRFTESVIKK